ncbi:hypothetical protein SFUMM280S_05842 [Streptomyces fumanus]
MDELHFRQVRTKHASVIGLGTWQLGADWGDVDDKAAQARCWRRRPRPGVTFFDTADVYGDGRSEETIAAFLRGRPVPCACMVATKMGRRVEPAPAELRPGQLPGRGTTASAGATSAST